MKIKNVLLSLSLLSCTAAQATNFAGLTVDNSVVVGNSVQAGGAVSAGTSLTVGQFISAGGYISSNNYISAIGYVSSNTYITAPQVYTAGYLRIGGASSISTGVSLAATIGAAATAPSYSSVAIGQFNALTANDGTAASPNTWVGKDPLFVLGNGADANTRKNAFAVYKDGTVTMSKAQGDIQMGQFGN